MPTTLYSTSVSLSFSFISCRRFTILEGQMLSGLDIASTLTSVLDVYQSNDPFSLLRQCVACVGR